MLDFDISFYALSVFYMVNARKEGLCITIVAG